MFSQLFRPLRPSAPTAGIEIFGGVIAGMDGEKVRRVRLIQKRNVAALHVSGLCGEKGYREGMLVVVRDQPSLDGIADSLPAFVVLIENVASFYGRMLVDHQHGVTVKRQFFSARLVTIQKPADGIAEPVGTLISAGKSVFRVIWSQP